MGKGQWWGIAILLIALLFFTLEPRLVSSAIARCDPVTGTCENQGCSDAQDPWCSDLPQGTYPKRCIIVNCASWNICQNNPADEMCCEVSQSGDDFWRRTHTCTPCGGDGQPICVQNTDNPQYTAPCKDNTVNVNGVCQCGALGQPACGGTTCDNPATLQKNPSNGLCEECGTNGKLACGYYADKCAATCGAGLVRDPVGYCWNSIICGLDGLKTCSQHGRELVGNPTYGSYAAPYMAVECDTCGSAVCAMSTDGDDDKELCAGPSSTNKNACSPTSQCGNAVYCPGAAPACGVSSSATCSSGTCRYACEGNGNDGDGNCWNEISECALPPLPGQQTSCDVREKWVGAMCNVDVVAPRIYEASQLPLTGLPYGKPSWTEGNDGTFICGSAGGFPACVAGRPLNFDRNGRRACGGHYQPPCNIGGVYVNGSRPTDTVPESSCIPDDTLLKETTYGNITSWGGMDRASRIFYLCNNTFTVSGGGDVRRVGDYLQLSDQQGVCCYNGAGGSSGNAWGSQRIAIEGSFVSDPTAPNGQRFVCDDLITGCRAPQCTCTGAPSPSSVACGVIIKHTPTSPDYCGELECGKGTKDCPSTGCGPNQCDIGGTCYNESDRNPSNPCQYCNLNRKTSWSNLARGSACGNGDDFCDSSAVCRDCDEDDDGYYGSIEDSVGQLCGAADDCVDSGNKNARYGAIAASQINPGANERPAGTMCTDGIDNDCDTYVDYDAFSSTAVTTYNPPLPNAGKGDSVCTVGVSGVSFACPVPINSRIMVNCTSSVADVRSLSITASGATCYENSGSWIAGTTKYQFPCDITAASGSITCAVNEAYSFPGSPKTATKTWGDASCPIVVCDQDGDGYNRTGVATCLNGNDCDDNNAQRSPGRPESWAAAGTCTDNFDNDCDLAADYDGGRVGGGSVTASGDTACAVQATAAGGPTNWCVSAGGKVAVNCTYHANTTQPRSKTATLTKFGVVSGCAFKNWIGNTAFFDCPAEGAAGVATLTCGVDTAISTLLPPPATKSITLNGDGGICDGTACSPCVCNNGPLLCDQDCDTYNASNGGRCATPRGNDCNDDPAQLSVDGNPVFLPPEAGGAPLTGANIYPGAPTYCGNDVNENCNVNCDPYCSVTWEGTIYTIDGLRLPGQVRYDAAVYQNTENDGDFAITDIPLGNRTLTGKANGYDPKSVLRNIDGCFQTVEDDLVLQTAQCQNDCTFEGFCRYDKCVGDPAAAACNITTVKENGVTLTLTPADQAIAAANCKFAEVGGVRELNSTHSINCCQGKIVPTGAVKSPLSIQGCSENLISMSRTVNYKGRIMTMEVLTYKKCE